MPRNTFSFVLCYHLLLPNPLPFEKPQLQLSLVTQTSCLGSSQREHLRRFDPCALIADDSRRRPDIPLGNALGTAEGP